MTRHGAEALEWADDEVGDAKLGHAGRTKRLVTMLRRAATHPAGKVSEVFTLDAERQGAYDFLEDERITPQMLADASVAAAVARAREHAFVFVAVDGSSLTFTDRPHKKELGAVGTPRFGCRGLKVMTGYACDPQGVPVGILDQSWWQRTQAPAQKSSAKRKRSAKRALSEKETQRWIDVIQASTEALRASDTRAWFQLDREGDSAEVLKALTTSGQWFTVRSSTNRRLCKDNLSQPKRTDADRLYLREELAKKKVLGTYSLDLLEGPKREARAARMSVRVAKVVLRLRHYWTKQLTTFEVTAVWAKETSRIPKGEKGVDWLLFTNRDVQSFDDAQRVIRGYALRWRIEELHKTWKSGACRVEDAQLHSKSAIVKWATILLTVAIRIERLKQLARQTPDAPAKPEFSPAEFRALLYLKSKQKKRNETIVDNPSIELAVRWIADLGGYTGKSSGGPPGSITIGRGLRDLLVVASVIEDFPEENRRK